MMVSEKEFQRLVKNITAAIVSNDTRKLTIRTAIWLINNYCLRPQEYWPLTYDWKRHTRKEFEQFFRTFSVYEWVASDVDLNYLLSWINKWMAEPQWHNPKNVADSIDCFKQRCRLVQLVRKNIGLKLYSIHYLWGYKSLKNYAVPLKARSLSEATSTFLAQFKSRSADTTFKIKKIRQVKDKAEYIVTQPPCSPLLFEFLRNEREHFDYLDKTKNSDKLPV